MPASANPPSTPELLDLDEIADRLEQVLETACADELEIVWIESRRRAVSTDRSTERTPLDRAIMIRVLDRGRLGIHRTSSGSVVALEQAVRQAVAQSRAREPLPGLPHLPIEGDSPTIDASEWDSQVAGLSRSKARNLLQGLAAKEERARIGWGTARVAVFSSRGLRRQAQVTQVDLDVSCGRAPGAGRAAGAAQSLSTLAGESVFERARRRHGPSQLGDPPRNEAPLLLAAECVASLCEILKRDAFSASSYQQGYSFLRDHLGDQVFDRDFHLRDDGTDPSGLPFPFDLEGTAKCPVDLITSGTPRTPALDQRQAAVLGLPPTGHSITGNDAQAENLFLLPGKATDDDLLQAASDGIWLGWLDRIECFEPRRLTFRARAGGVRQVLGGRLGASLPDLIWEDSLLRVLSGLQAIGDTPIVCSTSTLLGGTSAPALCISGGGSWRAAGPLR